MSAELPNVDRRQRQTCEWSDEKKPCTAVAVVFVMGKHRCAKHTPAGSPHCTHSLAPSGRCAYCGAPT